MNERKKMNPFSSALSAAPQLNDKQDGGHQVNSVTGGGQFQFDLKIKEFHPTGTNQTFFPKQSVDLQSSSSFSGACGIPTFSESLTLNDGTTAQLSNWKTNAPEFVPKDLNQLTG